MDELNLSPQPQEVTPTTSSKKIWVILGLLAVLAVAGGLYYYFMVLNKAADNDSPPSLKSANSSLQGFMAEGKNGFVAWSPKDELAYNVIKAAAEAEIPSQAPIQLKEGLNYLYSDEDMTAQDVLQRTNLKDNTGVVAIYKPFSFLMYPLTTYYGGPVEPTDETTGLKISEDPTKLLIPAYSGVIVGVTKATVAYDLYTADSEAVKNNLVCNEAITGDHGWHLIGGVDSKKLTESGYIPCLANINMAYAQDSSGEFTIKFYDGRLVADVEVPQKSLLWLRYGTGAEIPPVPTTDTTPATTPPTTPDATPPVITVLGLNPMEITVGGTYVEYGATATDAVDGVIAPETITKTGAVDTATAGTYTITYTVSDAADNEATATRTVNVVDVPDATAPVITVLGDNPLSITIGESSLTAYADAGATATDAVDGVIAPETITKTGTVDIATVGVYTITYTVSDAAGNEATATRTVNVVEAVEPTTVTYGVDYTGARNWAYPGASNILVGTLKLESAASDNVRIQSIRLQIPAAQGEGLTTEEMMGAIKLIKLYNGDALLGESDITANSEAVFNFDTPLTIGETLALKIMVDLNNTAKTSRYFNVNVGEGSVTFETQEAVTLQLKEGLSSSMMLNINQPPAASRDNITVTPGTSAEINLTMQMPAPDEGDSEIMSQFKGYKISYYHCVEIANCTPKNDIHYEPVEPDPTAPVTVTITPEGGLVEGLYAFEIQAVYFTLDDAGITSSTITKEYTYSPTPAE